MKSVVVFCGSASGNQSVYNQTAYKLGQTLASSQIKLVYGGAKVGIMGAVAQGCLDAGGEVIGVLPHFLNTKEKRHENLTQMIMVDSMHERKMKMNELSEGVIALPGGFGTMEELFEMLTWAQLGLHQKPIALLNIDGYYDYLFQFFDHMTQQGLLKPEYNQMVIKSTHIEDMITQMKSFQPLDLPQWMTKKET